ncbi:MAG: cache domain-containing protein, partial [Rhodobacteraceae bacterium]|nr:cache domain-containing protein [Paracoccaceae bacterium]
MPRNKRGDRRIKLPLTSIVGLGFGAFVALAIGLVLGLSVSANFSNTFSLLNDKTILSTDALETQLRTHFTSVEKAVVGLKPFFDDGTIGFEDPERTLEDLSIALKSNSDVTTLAVTATDGRRLGIYRAPSGKLWRIETDVPPPGMNMADLPALDQASLPTWGPLVEHEVGLFANVSVPLVRDGELIGTLTAASSMKDLSHIVKARDEGLNNTIFIVDGAGRVIMHSDETGL